MKQVVVFGTGDFAQVACSYLRADSPYDIVAFTVHERYMQERVVLGVPVVPFEHLLGTHPPEECAMFVAVGYKRLNQARAEIYEECKAKGYELITYVHSRACCSRDVAIGDNCFIFEQNVIQPFVTIGSNVVLWSGNHVGHHTQIGDHCFIASHAVISGRVHIGAHCFVGVNATFRDGVRVGPRCVIGGGAVIMHDTQADEVYAASATEASRVSSSRLRAFR
ncbi:transferase [Planctomycetaceae bacterium SCGC AG-212-D15]|nr:transferase [Planctomycetaceae bacterium SCGC AG-212-D15]